MSLSVPIDDLQPSQLFVDAQRLRAVLDWYDFDDGTYDPLPVIELDDRLVLSDGHTRAFVAWLAGDAAVEVIHDPDRGSLDIELYRTCVTWCRRASITTVGDLAGRVVTRERFLEEWVARCEAAATD